jgi:eukaryotic-like serine/threonine-protein kinase
VTSADGILLGRYWLHREIASGGMARVHLGRLVGPVGFTRTVAIKRLHAHMLKDEQFVTMFVDEARLVSRVSHPNVVPVLDVVTLQGELFLVMEYVHGEVLSKLLRDRRPSPPIAVAIVLGMLEGLHAAHEARDRNGDPLNIVHRDVSPQNVIVGLDGVPRVVDFGIAKAESRLLTTGDGNAAKGKLPYMAPEQLSLTPVDGRADVWAAAVVCWEALTGERLFQAQSQALLMRAVLEMKVPRPSSIDPALAPFDDVLARGIERSLDERFPSAREMALALEAVCPPAAARDVGAWVREVAGASLAEREEWIREMEETEPGEGPSVRTQVAELTSSAVDHVDAPSPETGRAAPDDATRPVGGRIASASPPAAKDDAATSGNVFTRTEAYEPPPRRSGSPKRLVFAGAVVVVAALGILFGVAQWKRKTTASAVPPPAETIASDAQTTEPPPAVASSLASAAPVMTADAGARVQQHPKTNLPNVPRHPATPVDSVRLDRRK